ncbi:Lrp/AsnC family transcriptional regulator [Streptomyces sp. TLI_146]|uniref:Lrp/AsnC family transcriptional regulator n=1 Tax=Streptomyces sp. TLI_146 TaxID=1938858 RepID=UPI000CC21E30|nr:Lrp/AsnC family transcriptional regulator [Streptomyces sp. TLI_146]PKV90103.1 DNA-binding Lrp family transcriptional regulator [Streptomyces sp. TLI_146]
MADPVLDEVDYLLITALQHAPRAAWQKIGSLIGLDATTAARRWDRLAGEGLAWLSCHPSTAVMGDAVVAYIEIDCVRGRLHEVCEQLVEDAPLFSLEYVTGSRDLLLTVVLRSHADLARYVGFRLGGLEGVAATRTQLVTTLHVEGSRWRLDRLHGVVQGPAHMPERAPAALGDADQALVLLLARDVRQSVERLARDSGLSPTTVRRRLARLEAARAISYRCEAARAVSGWPVSATLWAAVPAADLNKAVAQLSGMRETRLCASLSGPCNLMMTVWLRSIDDIQPFEASLVQRIPGLEVRDRSVTLWQLKHAGQVLDPQGRLLRSVPLSYQWDDSDAGAAEAALLERMRTGEKTPPVHP